MLLLAALLSSCSQFHYMTVSGVNVSKNDRHELVGENDTLRVEYHFSQHQGLIAIRLYNKTSEPLEVDWRKSAIIFNDKTVGYYDGKQAISGQVETSSSRFARWTSTSGDIKGEIQSSEQVQFLPPQSYLESKPVLIPLTPLPALSEEKAENLSFKYGGEYVIKYKRFPFGQENTPARFRSYLTLRIGKAVSQQEFAVEHGFYISEIWQSQMRPLFFASSLENRGDRFYVRP